LYLRAIFVNNAQNPKAFGDLDLQSVDCNTQRYAVFGADQINVHKNIFQRRWQRPRGNPDRRGTDRGDRTKWARQRPSVFFNSEDQ